MDNSPLDKGLCFCYYRLDMKEPVYKKELRRLGRAFETLNDKEREVLRLRFGLQNGRIHSLEDAGEKLGVTRERIRQIESKTLEKLRLFYSLFNWK